MLLSDKKRLDFVLSEAGIGVKALADLLELPDYKIKSIRGGRTRFSVELALAIESKLNFNFRWILTGQGSPYKNATVQADEEKTAAENPGNGVIELNHLDIVKLFKNKSLAKEINEILLEIEEVDQDHLREVKGLLRSELSRVKEKRIQKKTKAPGE